MDKIKVYNLEGKEMEQIALPEEISGLKFNADLVHQAYLAYLANHRQVLAHAKDRGEVRGGGKKPWRQKGTGRARHGSSRSPIWIGGGVTFGPTKERNFSQKINKKMKKQAMLMVLASRVEENCLIIVSDLILNQAKTKETAKIIKAILPENKSALIVLAGVNENMTRSAKNLNHVKIVRADSLNIYDLLSNKYIIMPKEVIGAILKNKFDLE